MKYYTITFPGECGQHVVETWNEDQIIESYFDYWSNEMKTLGREDQISRDKCIEDWITIHWAKRTDEFGNKYDYGI